MKTFFTLVVIFCAINSKAQNGSALQGDTKWIFITTTPKGDSCYLYNETLKKNVDGGILAWAKIEMKQFTAGNKIYKNIN